MFKQEWHTKSKRLRACFLYFFYISILEITTVDGCYLDISTEIVKDNYLVSKMTFNTWLCAEFTRLKLLNGTPKVRH